MPLIKRAADLFYTFRFLKILTTPFEKTEAYKLGIIDEKGKRIKVDPVTGQHVYIDNDNKKAAYTAFHKLVFNIKKILAKAPGGSSRLASYAAALYLLKEKLNLSKRQIKNIIQEANIDPVDFIKESSDWFVTEDKKLSPGLYRIKTEKVLNKTCDEVVTPKDRIRVKENSYPIGEIFGLDIYEVTHAPTNQSIYVASSELYK